MTSALLTTRVYRGSARSWLTLVPDARGSGRGCDQVAEPIERELEPAQRRAEREPEVAAKPRRPAAPSLARVHIEELAWHRDHLALERGPEEAHPVADRRRQ